MSLWRSDMNCKYILMSPLKNLARKGLTHWGRVMHICASKLTIIGSDNDLSPGRRQAIIWNNAGILSIGLLGTNFSEILIEILTFFFKKMCLKVSSAKWRPFCLGLNVLMEETWAIRVMVRSKTSISSMLSSYQCSNSILATLIPAGSNHTPNKMWDEITYPFPNFKGCTVEVAFWSLGVDKWFCPTLYNGCTVKSLI